MLTEKERKAQCEAFIKSNKFGLDTWVTIRAFDENVKNMILTINLYDKLIKKIDDGLFSDEFPPAQILRIKQHIVLDMILKTEIIIESSLIFIYQLSKGSKGYRALPKTMSRYNNELVNVVMKKVWKRNFPIKTGLGLPLISHLHLEKEEAKVLVFLYQESERNAWEALGKIVDFDKFRTVYNKYKHGLIFRTGGGLKGGNSRALTLEKSSLIALDRKGMNDMPKSYIPYDTDDILVQGWFNALSHLNFGQKLMDEIFTIIKYVEEIVFYVCSNHKTFAINCGERYLPFGWTGDKQISLALLVSLPALTDKQTVLLKSITDKIFPEMNTQRDETYEDFTYKKAHLAKAIQNNTVTNILQRPKA
jgi:hypothetical protein